MTPNSSPGNGETYITKRALDIVGACAGCAVFTPLVAVIAIVKSLEDGGPPFFLQVRVGKGRKPFTVIKIRTMHDGQTTPLGALLRRTGLDEAPQFMNVLKGEMSIVGPRPLTEYDIRRLGWDGQDVDWRFAVKPGITGMSQLLAGRGVRYSRRLDRLYLRSASLTVDAGIIASSIAVNGFGKARVRRWLSRQR
jgi:lipopolysaccharide/colanic/teichoic acid biosynthesis glycosyltransferase